MKPDDSPFATRVAAALDSTPLRLSFFLLLVLAGFWPIFVSPRNGGWSLDWLFFQFFDEVARKTILEFHQLPLWNPYFCGGIPQMGNPQTTFLVPTFPLVLIFGTTFGERLSNLPVMVLGCEGMWRLVRHLGLRRSAALLGALAFPFFGRTFAWLFHGQHGLIGFALSGWVLFGYLKGLERPRYLALGAFFLAWQMCFRGIETVPGLALGLGVWATLEAARRWRDEGSARAAIWPLVAALVLGALALGYAGLRMAPVLETLLRHPRIVDETRARTVSNAFFQVYGLPPTLGGFESPGYCYVGVTTYLLFVGALSFARVRRRAWIPLLTAVFFMLMTLGMRGPLSPLYWLHRLPLLRSLRNPTLWSCPGALFVVLSASYGVDALDGWLRERGDRIRRLARFAIPALVLAVGLELLVQGNLQMVGDHSAFTWQTPPRVTQEFRQGRGNYFEFPLWPYLDRGTLSCYDETPFVASAALRPDLPSEEYLADSDAGALERVRWSPNRLELKASLRRPSTVIINQNYDEGWHSSVGDVHSLKGLLAVDLPAGEHSLTLRMWPRMCTVGLCAMALALLGTLMLWRRPRSRVQR